MWRLLPGGRGPGAGGMRPAGPLPVFSQPGPRGRRTGFSPPTTPGTTPKPCCCTCAGELPCQDCWAFLPGGERCCGPFCGCPAGRLRPIAGENGLAYVTDSSNLSGEYARNRLRLEVLPVLEELNPGFLQAVSRMVETLRQDQDSWRPRPAICWSRSASPGAWTETDWPPAHPSLRSRALELYWEEREPGSLEKRHLDALARCISRGGEADLPGGVRAPMLPRGVFSGKAGEAPALFRGGRSGRNGSSLRQGPGFAGKRGANREETPKIHNLLFKNALDYDIITGNLKARSRREGDRFSPAGRRITKSLKGLFPGKPDPSGPSGTEPCCWNGRAGWFSARE